jgi:hypothetical protein
LLHCSGIRLWGRCTFAQYLRRLLRTDRRTLPSLRRNAASMACVNPVRSSVRKVGAEEVR